MNIPGVFSILFNVTISVLLFEPSLHGNLFHRGAQDKSLIYRAGSSSSLSSPAVPNQEAIEL
jgi:hypothetical protein